MQRYVSNDQADFSFRAKQIDKECKYLSNFPAVTLRALMLVKTNKFEVSLPVWRLGIWQNKKLWNKERNETVIT
jgi:hypothetical protein